MNHQPCGLVNKGHTCYINTALQCMSWSQNLSRFFKEHKTFDKDANFDLNILFHIQDIIRIIHDPKNKDCSIWISGFLRTLGKSKMMTFINQLNYPNDLHEFLAVFLDLLCEAMIVKTLDFKDIEHRNPNYPTSSQTPPHLTTSTNSSSTPKIDMSSISTPWINMNSTEDSSKPHAHSPQPHAHSPFHPIIEGCSQIDITCSCCHKTYTQYEKFTTLMVCFDNDNENENKSKSDIVDMINANFKNEHIVNRSCDFCHKKVDGVKSQRIINFPQVLMIMIKRYDEKGRKILNRFTFYESIHLNHLGVHPNTRQEYNISSIACHVGNQRNGHYYGLGRDRKADKWIIMNDEDVTYLKHDQYLPSSSQFYVLFYEKDIQ